MPKNPDIKSVLIIGSGPIIIGQACEFDYSGSQASRSLREEGIKVSLINSNPATIMTDRVTADHIFLKPLTKDSIVEILKEALSEGNRIDAVLPTMGGQTALNLAVDLEEMGIWEEYRVKVIGVDINAIKKTENREFFRQLMIEHNIPVPKSAVAKSFLEGREIAQEIGFPLVIRPSFTLGGTGASHVWDKKDFEKLLNRGLQASPVHEVLIEQSIYGWKEFELELLRDNQDDIVIICSIENFDPMGIHTGDSITVAPALTLPDTVYQQMRNMAIRMMRSIGTFAGGCNVQFAVHPETEELAAIEINPRVSRSSALASKATGYPIARIAAKLAIGYNLHELPNQITQTTSAYFEPALDYVVVKIPRWNFDKFRGADKTVGLQMKSVGESMAIGRSFLEALQKGVQSLETTRLGVGADGKEMKNPEVIAEGLKNPSWNRLFLIKDALSIGVPIDSVHKLTQIDKWFLHEIQRLVDFEKELSHYTIEDIPEQILLRAKRLGYADAQIAHLLRNCTEEEIYSKRTEMGIRRVYKLVDTCAAEFGARTPYYYSTFEEENESVCSSRKKVIVLGSGPNRIGQGIEFDYVCVHGVMAAHECGYESIMINCNPETVSTDFNVSDKLYFEPVFWEHVREIIEHEKPVGVIVQLGGQTALKLSEKFEQYNIPIIGTSFENMDIAEDRGRFSDMLQNLGIPYPNYGVAHTAEEAIKVAHEVGYPVLVRPSYVLGGHGMNIVIDDEDLEKKVVDLLKDLPGNRLLIDHFLDRSFEAEVDAICDGEDVLIIGVMEHIEPAGIHSGDSTAVLPPFDLSPFVMHQIEEYTQKIARHLEIRGFINMQFVVKESMVYVIEANPRASRTVPFISKAYDVPFANIATKIMLGKNKLSDFDISPKMNGYAIKIPVFSFDKFPNVDKQLGPEMKSTGESILFIKNLKDEFFIRAAKEKNLYLSR